MSTAPDYTPKRERQPIHLQAEVPATLTELAEVANREHAACEDATQSALSHAIAAGRALNAAHAQTASGEWRRWLKANFAGSSSCANNYMRFAVYAADLDPELSLKQAKTRLLGCPEIRPRGIEGHPPSVQAEAVRLVRDEGLSGERAAEALGVSKDSVCKYVDPHAYRERRAAQGRRRRAAADALAAAERDKAIRAAVRKAGAALSEAYSMGERMGRVLAQARDEATTGEARAALDEATADYHRMRDHIVRALGVES